MLKKNSFLLGTVSGLILPGIVFFCSEVLKKDLRLFGKEDVLYLLSLAVNFFIIRYCFRSDREETGKGIVLSTFSCTLIFFFLKSRQ